MDVVKLNQNISPPPQPIIYLNYRENLNYTLTQQPTQDCQSHIF